MIMIETYGNEVDDTSLDQERVWEDRVLPEFEWDEMEVSRLVEQLAGKYLVSNDADSTMHDRT